MFLFSNKRKVQFSFAGMPIREKDPRITFGVVSEQPEADTDLGWKLFDSALKQGIHSILNSDPDVIVFRNISGLPYTTLTLMEDIREPYLHGIVINYGNPHLIELNNMTERYI